MPNFTGQLKGTNVSQAFVACNDTPGHQLILREEAHNRVAATLYSTKRDTTPAAPRTSKTATGTNMVTS